MTDQFDAAALEPTHPRIANPIDSDTTMSHFHYAARELHCESVPVSKIADEFGTPLWVYSQAAILEQFNALKTAFAEADPTICYSVKANSNLSILKLLNDAGSSFDIVSGGELHRVKQAGADTERVCFAGVGKTDPEIHAALEANILMFNVESEPELDAISAVAAAMGVVAPVALRLNPDIDAKTHSKTTTGKKGNKFGIDLERGGELADKVLADPHLELRGIHMHLGSPIYTVDPFAAAADKAVELVAELRARGHKTNWINLGGGFGLDYQPGQTPPMQDYADVIVPKVLKANCSLALEPGRAIVGNAGVLIGQVVYVKREGGKRFVIQDAAMNDLVRPAMYEAYHGIWPVVSGEIPADLANAPESMEPADVVGPVCESGDCFAKDRRLPDINRGDLIATFSAGAYGTVMSSNYNTRPRGAEVLVDGDSYRLIRRRETVEDLVAAEIV